MDLNTWLDAERGRASALAAHFHLTPAAVTHWRTSGVPLDRFVEVVRFTDNAVSLDSLLHQRLRITEAKPASIETAAHSRGEE